MPTIAEAYKEAYAKGKPYGVLPVDLRLLLMHDENLSEQIDVIYDKDKVMTNYPLFCQQVDRLIADEPVEYIINEADFLQHRLYVDSRVLIPRGETEELVAAISENIGDYFDARNYLVCADIGTGSGAISVALKEAFPNWLLLASDISQDALDVAKMNFEKYGVAAQTYLGDALAPYIENKINLDILVCNPPYILNKEDAQASVRDFEPASALWMDKGHSVYESIFRDYKKVKKGALYMAFEISPDLVDYLTELMMKYLEDYEFHFADDLNKMKRFLFVYCR
jgi:release factor glutamine methyltransferase